MPERGSRLANARILAMNARWPENVRNRPVGLRATRTLGDSKMVTRTKDDGDVVMWRSIGVRLAACLMVWLGVTFFSVSASAQASECAPGYEEHQGLCYRVCNAGFTGSGPVCWRNCPAGFRDDGAACRKDAIVRPKETRDRGAGTPLTCGPNEQQFGAACYANCRAGFGAVADWCWATCADGFHDDGAVCRRDPHIFSKQNYYGGVGRSCRDGYTNVAGVCWQNCPADYHDDGLVCRRDAVIISKERYVRPPIALHACPIGKSNEGGLCYMSCPAGFRGVGPTCYADCPAGFHDDGAVCRSDPEVVPKTAYERGIGQLRRTQLRDVIARYINDSYTTYRNSPARTRLTAAERTFLAPFFPSTLLDRVRIVENDGFSGPLVTVAVQGIAAMTVGADLVLIQRGQRSNLLLKHELVHTCQYRALGQEAFGRTYADQYVDGGYGYGSIVFEQEAFAFAAGAVSINSFTTGAPPSTLPMYLNCN